MKNYDALIEAVAGHDQSISDKAQKIEKWLDTLSDREKDILEMSFGVNGTAKTLAYISSRFGLPKERVCEIRDKAIIRLQWRWKCN
jgi:RNA polymerase primary sigma factor